jgi:hypothetical protein
MQTLSKSVFLALALSCASSTSFADNFPVQNSTPLPMASCGSGYCTFSDLQDHAKGGQAAYYYCVPNSNSTSIHMQNHAVLITGFNGDGEYNGPASDLSKYYFGTYIDPGKSKDLHWVYAADNNGQALQCYAVPLPDLGGRVLNPNPPQLAKRR